MFCLQVPGLYILLVSKHGCTVHVLIVLLIISAFEFQCLLNSFSKEPCREKLWIVARTRTSIRSSWKLCCKSIAKWAVHRGKWKFRSVFTFHKRFFPTCTHDYCPCFRSKTALLLAMISIPTAPRRANVLALACPRMMRNTRSGTAKQKLTQIRLSWDQTSSASCGVSFILVSGWNVVLFKNIRIGLVPIVNILIHSQIEFVQGVSFATTRRTRSFRTGCSFTAMESEMDRFLTFETSR